MLTKINDSLFLVPRRRPRRAAGLDTGRFSPDSRCCMRAVYPLGIWSDRIGQNTADHRRRLTLAAVELGFSFDGPFASRSFCSDFYGVFYALTRVPPSFHRRRGPAGFAWQRLRGILHA